MEETSIGARNAVANGRHPIEVSTSRTLLLHQRLFKIAEMIANGIWRRLELMRPLAGPAERWGKIPGLALVAAVRYP